ncbi:CinA family protein [Streptomyces griseoviridis]|uniref:Nicotinamide-nucleotide amidase n=3 Tax=Streptomyces TaxID=1883 RepID=A0ABT9LLQ6_STRGD|nr:MULTISPECIES: CinA family protein [Streptomyces]MDP9684454.1 nicotinamide-nucleotide amidase [Streptomyces griseoviridis]GGS51126.1 competence damage-inducible protein A [Streptomyces niveoruber]GGT05669.1 competence damage-inducible protein A [Streptomyces griseoviridis]GGU51759.1 competence damage-inducible protein A [Streptomyces daghestanicus]GHI30584.1 competence damage-inducible protein A [Streptomyces daghestanicus]
MSPEAADVVRLLTVNGATVAVAESLTGGLVAAEITSVPGASRVFRGSVTAYATELKHRLLGVDAGLLAARGAVDPQVAAQMATGVRKALGADWGVATTGVAGPDPQDGQAVGTVFVAVDGPSGAAKGSASGGKVEGLRLNGDRAEIRRESVRSVLALLLRELVGEQTRNERAQDTEQNGGF